jgi:hypothetical protein
MFTGRLRAGLETDLFGRGFNPNCLAIDSPLRVRLERRPSFSRLKFHDESLVQASRRNT